ncbi:MAG TPA: hypothetical protein DEP48_00560 [Persephonella sp.]|uniref:AAA family ATPase n=1 Tax=Persephonella TaxID=182899 RepID=UPI0005A0FC1E|nr:MULTISPECIES: AAA family ATPase [Persephonella]HCB68828.1 hypothetical protein [Persephonella sp.]
MILKVKLENCYGIRKLDYEFNFENGRVFAIYAPNGTMKTSFAKTFKDYSEKKETKDLHFPHRETKVELKLNGEDLNRENVFVIESYNEDYASKSISVLLASKKLRANYDKIYKDFKDEKNILIKELSNISKVKPKDIENIFKEEFNKSLEDFLTEIDKKLKEKDDNYSKYSELVYSDIFNNDVLNLLSNKDVKKHIEDYIKKYKELINKSPYFRENFDHYNANEVIKSLKGNNFFKAGHTISLSNGTNKEEFNNEKELNKFLEEQKKKILENEELKSIFEKIDKGLNRNQKLRNFRSILRKNPKIIVEFENLKKFKEKIWLSYLIKLKESSLNFIEKYNKYKEDLNNLLEKARNEETDWEKIIEIFNNKFIDMPFELAIENKEEVILKQDVPSIKFIFKDGEDKKEYNDKKNLISKLSNGEKRALYLLDIIFDLEAQKKSGKDTIIIIDDIADSFDYKNKYAIIEYLKEIAEYENFYIIILTHNFDFFRTIRSRIIVNKNKCKIANRLPNGKIKLNDLKEISNPFEEWKKYLENFANGSSGTNKKNAKKIFIATIPFIRNLAEYIEGKSSEDYKKLTYCLHYKPSKNIKLKDLKEIYEKYIKNFDVSNLFASLFTNEELNTNIYEMIFNITDIIKNDRDNHIKLEGKIVLAIATRLKAEKYMLSKLNNDIDENEWKFTRYLFERFREISNDSETLKKLERVLIITPEYIHINAFMYEPLVDVSIGELKKLYAEDISLLLRE